MGLRGLIMISSANLLLNDSGNSGLDNWTVFEVTPPDDGGTPEIEEILVGSTTAGFYKSLDGGSTWVEKHVAGVTGNFAFIKAGDNLVAWDHSTARNCIWVSYDIGDTWIKRSIPRIIEIMTDPTITAIDYMDNGELIAYFYTGEHSYKGAWVSTNEGVSWTRVGASNKAAVHDMRYLGNGVLLISSMFFDGEVHRSTDYGRTWALNTTITGDFPYVTEDGIYVAEIASLGEGIALIFTCGWSSGPGSRIYRTINYGNSWDYITTIGTSGSYHDLAFSLGNGLVFYLLDVSNIYRSTDYGLTWEHVTSKSTYGVAYNNINVYLGNLNFDGTIYKSEDLGDTWYNVITNFPNIALRKLWAVPIEPSYEIITADDGFTFIGPIGFYQDADPYEPEDPKLIINKYKLSALFKVTNIAETTDPLLYTKLIGTFTYSDGYSDHLEIPLRVDVTITQKIVGAWKYAEGIIEINTAKTLQAISIRVIKASSTGTLDIKSITLQALVDDTLVESYSYTNATLGDIQVALEAIIGE